MTTLKAAVQRYQTSLLRLTRTTPGLPTSVTTGLGTLQREDHYQRRKTVQQIQELQRQLAPSATTKASGPVPMDLDAILGDKEQEEEEYS